MQILATLGVPHGLRGTDPERARTGTERTPRSAGPDTERTPRSVGAPTLSILSMQILSTLSVPHGLRGGIDPEYTQYANSIDTERTPRSAGGHRPRHGMVLTYVNC